MYQSPQLSYLIIVQDYRPLPQSTLTERLSFSPTPPSLSMGRVEICIYLSYQCSRLLSYNFLNNEDGSASSRSGLSYSTTRPASSTTILSKCRIDSSLCATLMMVQFLNQVRMSSSTTALLASSMLRRVMLVDSLIVERVLQGSLTCLRPHPTRALCFCGPWPGQKPAAATRQMRVSPQ